MIKIATNIIKGLFKQHPKARARYHRIEWLREKVLKHQDDNEIKLITLGNVRIHYKRPYELIHTYKEVFQNEIYRFEKSKSNLLIIDCGANIGISVLYFKTLYPGCNLIAFEPDKGNFELLEKNVILNGLQQIELVQAAVWIENGEVTFAGNESEASHISKESSGVNVKSVRLNDVLQQHNEIDFLKIDIEGAECQVIPDCEKNLHRVKNIFLEYHGKTSETENLANMMQILYASGFKVYIKNAADNLLHPFVEKTSGTSYDVQLNLFCYR